MAATQWCTFNGCVGGAFEGTHTHALLFFPSLLEASPPPPFSLIIIFHPIPPSPLTHPFPCPLFVQNNGRFSSAAAQFSSFDEILDKFETERQMIEWMLQEGEMN